MEKAFHPSAVEAGVYDFWQRRLADDSGANADRNDPHPNPRFSMLLPPPNVTGQLHIGHALTITIQDALVRYKKMRGFDSRWMPGLDHAGIATQSVVEKRLMKEEGKRRQEMGREAFLEAVWAWRWAYGERIETQIKRMGASVDWPHAFFTMDEQRSNAVDEAFIQLFDRGLVYRAMRLVNWSPALQTALSDLEVDWLDIAGPKSVFVPALKEPVTFGQIYHIEYPLLNHTQRITVSTTRPETMLGDVAIAIHSSDERYKHLHGAIAVHPITNQHIPIITDDILVDPELGSGAVKITPAHDEADWQCGLRHGLRHVQVFTEDGRMAPEAGKWAGRHRFECRSEVVAELQAQGLLRGVDDFSMRVPICSRSGDVVEPMLMPQWYVACGKMAKRAMEMVDRGDVQMSPPYAHRTWERWLGNIQDWCISRQLWWGHRVPAYRVILDHSDLPDGHHLNANPHVLAGEDSDSSQSGCQQLGSSKESCDASHVSDNQADKVTSQVEPARFDLETKSFPDHNSTSSSSKEMWVAARSEEEAVRKAGGRPVERDEDVLDTWFSSALLPLSCAGWPATISPSLYPLDVMETGQDILFFWVARMAMLCSELHPEGAAPFRQVLLHPMVRDAQGRKMSKSLGNVIDPLDVVDGISRADMLAKLDEGNIDAREAMRAKEEIRERYDEHGIPACGTDALRLALAGYLEQNEAIHMDVQQVVTWRKFCNKLWNAAAFCLKQPMPDDVDIDNCIDFEKRSLEQRWILSRLQNCTQTCVEGLENAQLGAVANAIRAFVYDELCGVYLELCKPLRGSEDSACREQRLQTLRHCLEQTLRLCHPLAPFITEELWHRLNGHAAPEMCLVHLDYPLPDGYAVDIDMQTEAHMDVLLQTVQAVRSLRERHLNEMKRYGLNPGICVYVSPSDADLFNLLDQHKWLLLRLLNLPSEDLTIAMAQPNEHSLLQPCYGGRIAAHVDLTTASHKMDDVAIRASLAKVQARERKLVKQLHAIEQVLSSTNFLQNAPPAKVEAQQTKLAQTRSEIDALSTISDTFTRWTRDGEDSIPFT